MTEGRRFATYISAIVLTVISYAGATARDPVKARDAMQTALYQTTQALRRRFDAGRQQVDIRDFSDAALASLVLKGDGRQATYFIKKVIEQQRSDGSLPWVLKGVPHEDENAIEFGTASWGPILIGYSSLLPADVVASLRSHAKQAIVALKRHKPPIQYTNIYLLNTINLLVLGRAIGDASAIDAGDTQLNNWISTVKSVGIHEFDSPTYYMTDINALLIGFLFLDDNELKKKIKSALDFMWTDIMGNYLQGKLVGPHSRDYDFLDGTGDLDIVFMLEGWIDPDARLGKHIGQIYQLLNLKTTKGYLLPSEATGLVALPAREVISRWGPRPFQTRTVYISGLTAIGTVGAGDFGPIDKLFSIDMAPNAVDRPKSITLVVVENDNPYGDPKLDQTGHFKPGHLPSSPIMVQYREWALVSLSADFSNKESADGAVNVLLPAAADQVLLDGQSFIGDNIAGSKHSVIGIRIGSQCAIIRFIRADNVSSPVLKIDGEGRRKDTARFTFRQDETGGPSQVSLIARGGPCLETTLNNWVDQVKHLNINSSIANQILNIEAHVPGRTLSIYRNAVSMKFVNATGAKTIDITSPLSVNGQDIGVILR